MATGASARRGTIARLLNSTGFVSVTDLTVLLGVSDMTIRRDLKRLEAEGVAKVVHGGASLPAYAPASGTGFLARARRRIDAKAAIALAAVDLIPPDGSVVLDAGTTVFELARALPGRFQGYVFTHSIPVMVHMMGFPDIHLHGLGGELQPESQALIGPTTIENLAKVRASVLFLGAAAIDERGLFVAKDLERSTKSALIRSVDRVVVLADQSKFRGKAPVRLCPLEVADVLVTDATPPPVVKRACHKAGIEIIIADPVRTDTAHLVES